MKLKTDKLESHFNFKLTDKWNKSLDFYIYEDSTADGYSVFITTDNPQTVLINENVHYYDSDLKDTLVYEIQYSSKDVETVIYIDDLHSYFVTEAMDELKDLMEEEIKENK